MGSCRTCRWTGALALLLAWLGATAPVAAGQLHGGQREMDRHRASPDLGVAADEPERERSQADRRPDDTDVQRDLNRSRARRSRHAGDGAGEPRRERRHDRRPDVYSARTGERLHPRAWEKVDFLGTAVTYGGGYGLSLAAGLSQDDQIVPLMLVGTAAGASAAVITLSTGADRGDLPLVLGVMGYVPLTVGLAAAVIPLALHDDSTRRRYERAFSAAGISGLLSVPAAVLLARHTDVDPGDVQLVRDAGFWAAAAGLGVAGVAELDEDGYLLATLLGLQAGVGLGLLGSSYTDLSLERVRVATLAGYGGALVGAIAAVELFIVAGWSRHEERIFAATTSVGALAGIVLSLATTGGLDRMPEGAEVVHDQAPVTLAPALLPARGRGGQGATAFGLMLSAPGF